LQAPAGASVSGQARQSFNVSAESTTTATWQVGFEKGVPALGHYLFSVRGHDSHDRMILPAALDYTIAAELADYLKEGTQNYRLDIFDVSKWKGNQGAGVKADLAITPEGYWQMKTTCPQGSDRWCYPKFTLDHPIKEWTPDSFVVIRGRCQGGSAKVVLWESGGALYLTNLAIFPPDGEWHTARISYTDFSMFALTPDDNQRLDLDKVTMLSVGSNPGPGDNVLEVSDFYIVNTKRARRQPCAEKTDGDNGIPIHWRRGTRRTAGELDREQRRRFRGAAANRGRGRI